MAATIDPLSPLPSDSELKRRREQIHHGLRRANTAALLVLLIVVGLSFAAMWQAFRAGRNATEADAARGHAEHEKRQAQLAESRALLEQARAQRRTGEAGQRFNSIAVVAQAAAIQPSLELRNEAAAALASPEARFVPVWTNQSPSFVAQFSPDFERIAVSDSNGQIEIRRLSDGQKEIGPPAVDSVLRQLWFSPNGLLLAAEYFNGAGLIWELSDHRAVLSWNSGRSFRGFGADSLHLLFADDPEIVRCETLGSEQELWREEFESTSPTFNVQPGGAQFACSASEQSRLQIRSMKDGKLLHEISDPSPVGAAAWSRDGQLLVLGRDNGWVETWDTKSWIQRDRWRAHDDVVVALAFDKQGRWFASSSWDRTVKFWGLPGYRPELVMRGYEGQSVGQFSPDGKYYACVKEGDVLGETELIASTVLRRLYVPPGDLRGSWSVDVSPTGRFIAAGYSDGLLLLDFATGRELDWRTVTDCRSVLFTPDETAIITSGVSGLRYWPVEVNSSSEIQLQNPKIIREGPPDGPHFVCSSLSSNAHWLAAANYGGSVAIYNLKNPAERFALTNHPNTRSVALSPDGQWVAAGTWKGQGVKVWDLASRQLLRELPVEDSAMVSFSPDSQLLVTASRRYQFWKAGSWTEQYRRPDLSGNAPPAAFSPDGHLVAVLKNLHSVELLEAQTGRSLAEFAAPGSTSISWLRFAPEGAALVALEWTRGIQVWDLRSLRRELASLGLDWKNKADVSAVAKARPALHPPSSGATSSQAEVAQRTSFSVPTTLRRVAGAAPGSFFYLLTSGGVVLSVIIGVWTLRYNRRMIRNYEEVEALVEDRNQQLQSARTELLHGQKMRALGTLATGIAHDFNNLLSVIRMSNKLIDRQTQASPEIRDHVADVEQAVLQGKSLVGSMLGYARSDDGEIGPADASAAVQGAVSLLTSEFLSGISLTLDLDRQAPRVKVSRSRLEQILLNLLVNASEAMQGQGKLKIVLRAHSALPSHAYVLRPGEAGVFVELNVIDTGPGFPPEIGERLFEPFFTTKHGSASPGTGLGLSLVYSIAQEEKLGLSAESTSGQGATFTIVMPAA